MSIFCLCVNFRSIYIYNLIYIISNELKIFLRYKKISMSTDLTIAELKEQIRKYEAQLEQEKLKNAKQREKITKMSAEVVDSNPYRYS